MGSRGPSSELKVGVPAEPARDSVGIKAGNRKRDILTNPPLAVEPTTGEVHLRHHISPTGFYRGKKVLKAKGE
jgi:large subunit ribosomal protein L32